MLAEVTRIWPKFGYKGEIRIHLIDSPHMSEADRNAVLTWRAHNWTPQKHADEIEFWEVDFSTPDDPTLAFEQEVAEAALIRVARLKRQQPDKGSSK